MHGNRRKSVHCNISHWTESIDLSVIEVYKNKIIRHESSSSLKTIESTTDIIIYSYVSSRFKVEIEKERHLMLIK